MNKVVVIVLLTIIMGINNLFATILVDTIISPPISPNLISGIDYPCVGDTCIYKSDIPLGCESNWYVNGNIQPSSTATLEIIWTSGGSNNIVLELECNTTFLVDSLLVIVGDNPDSPIPIIGDNNVCLGMISIYNTGVNEDEYCQWKVDGIIQISNTTELIYYWDELGLHTIEVSAVNDCGISDPEVLIVEVFEMPIVELGNDTSIFIGQSIVLDAGNPGCSIIWSTGDTTQTITANQTGSYEVMVSNPCGDVWDDIYVDVIVEIKELTNNKIIFYVKGDYLKFDVKGEKIKSIKINDISGRSVGVYNQSDQIYIPKNGMYVAIILTFQNNIYTSKVFKSERQ